MLGEMQIILQNLYYINFNSYSYNLATEIKSRLSLFTNTSPPCPVHTCMFLIHFLFAPISKSYHTLHKYIGYSYVAIVIYRVATYE